MARVYSIILTLFPYFDLDKSWYVYVPNKKVRIARVKYSSLEQAGVLIIRATRKLSKDPTKFINQ